ncbi:hypothetical protein MTO96_021965 [Rhipicephalus appendiculatus]
MNALVFIVVLVATGSLATIGEARCPEPGGVSDCRYETCTDQQCAAQGLECCPKPCGGYLVRKGSLRGARALLDLLCEIFPALNRWCAF